MVKIDYQAIGMRIKIARIKKGFTQEYLSEQCGVSPQHVSNIENGKTKLSLHLLVLIANCLNVSVDELLCDVVDRSEAVFSKEIKEIFDQCNPEEIRLLLQALKTNKEMLTQLKKFYLSNQ